MGEQKMTIYQLVERDFRRAELNFKRAKTRPNIPSSELEHLEELVVLRKEIFEHIKNTLKGTGETK